MSGQHDNGARAATESPAPRRFSHLFDLAYTLENEHPEGEATIDQHRAALLKRVAEVLADDGAAEAAFLSGLPLDTYEVD